MSFTAENAAQFRSLPIPGKPIVLTNVCDPGQRRGGRVKPSSTTLATASYAIAAVHGLEDGQLDVVTNLQAISRICPTGARHNKPIMIDMQDGYDCRLEEAIESIIVAGASGCISKTRSGRQETFSSRRSR
jgi:2-methylisocitrate lyase-like PEP mutase family enzyme